MPLALPLPLLFAAEGVLAVAKPAGLPVHGGPRTASSVEDLLARALGRRAPTILHRLDTDTSGVLLLARTRAARVALQRGFEQRTTRKAYLGLLRGGPGGGSGMVEAALAKRSSRAAGWRMVAAADGAPAATRWRRVGAWRAGGRAGDVLLFVPRTGRTHQLRVHATLLAPGAHLLGDDVYGPGGEGRLRLHARAIAFTLPSGRRSRVRAAMPADWPEISSP